MKIFDTHFHYYGTPSPVEYYRNIAADSLGWLLAAGAGYDESRTAQSFAAAVENAWFAAGVHPHSASDYDDISMFDEFKGAEKLVAIGEIGLDFYYENSPLPEQIKVFEKFLELALCLRLPAIIHCRDRDGQENAYRESYALLRNFAMDGGRFVVHCFTGTPAWAEKFLVLGAFLGVTGIITFPKAANVRDNINLIPDDRLLLETDSPYLAPTPWRGKENNPGYIIKIAEEVARIKAKRVEEVALLTSRNAFTFFSLAMPEELQ